MSENPAYTVRIAPSQPALKRPEARRSVTGSQRPLTGGHRTYPAPPAPHRPDPGRKGGVHFDRHLRAKGGAP